MLMDVQNPKSSAPTADEIMTLLSQHQLDPVSINYVRFHQRRYAFLVQLLTGLIDHHSALRILDVGPAYQTFLLRHFFSSHVINSLGYQHNLNELREGEKHFESDLNTSQSQWPDLPQHDLILFCEVIEHLYSNPKFVMQRLADNLKPGGFLMIQTPNAVAIHKRLRMLIGQNPFQLLQDNQMGHFREYTIQELQNMVRQVGLEISSINFLNYFNYSGNALNRLFLNLQFMIPPKWRDGITIVATKT